MSLVLVVEKAEIAVFEELFQEDGRYLPCQHLLDIDVVLAFLINIEPGMFKYLERS